MTPINNEGYAAPFVICLNNDAADREIKNGILLTQIMVTRNCLEKQRKEHDILVSNMITGKEEG
jgi:hypothetical protein